MTICFSREVANNLHKKGWGGRQMFLIFFKLFFKLSFLCAFVKKKYFYNVQQPPTETRIPQEISISYLLPRFLFHEPDLLWINLHFLKMNYSDIRFSALQSWTATLRPPRASSHSPGAELLGCEDTISEFTQCCNTSLSITESWHTSSCHWLCCEASPEWQENKQTIETLLQVLSVLVFSLN